MTRLFRRSLWIAAVLFASASAPAAQGADDRAAEAPAETPAQALQRARRGLEANPDDAGLLALKLRLERDGVGMAGVPPLARRAQQTQTARRLVAVDPGNALGNLVVGLDDLREFEFFHDRVRIPFVFHHSNESIVFASSGLSPQYIETRFLRGRFNTDLLTDVFVSLDNSSPARGKDVSARRHLEAALGVDPALRDAYEPLATLGAMTEAWTDVAAVATRAEAQFPDWGAPLLWQALAQYRSGDAAASEATFDRARALLAADERDRYDDLTALLKPADVSRYRTDTEAFARAFWNREDVRLLTPANERRAEHYARRTEADLHFGWSRADGTETPRGRIWARYGAPAKRTRFSGNMYCDAAGTPCPFMPDVPYDVWEYEGFRMVFEDQNRSGAYDTYVPPAAALSSADPYMQSTSVNDDYIAVDRQLQREAPEVSTYAPARRERVPFLATAFRGASGQTDLVVAFGVPLAARPTTDAALDLRTGVFALRDAGPVSERRRHRASVPASETVPLGSAAVWVGAETLPLAPGVYTVAAEFDASDGAAVGYERASVSVPAFSASGLQISGLLLAASAAEGASGPLQRGGFGIVPLPLAAAPAGQPLTVYAEAYGLALEAGWSRYSVELALVPADDRSALGRLFGQSRRRGVSTQSEATGSHADEAVVLSVDTQGQPAGTYRLALRIADRVSGASVETEREVTLE